MTEYCHVFETAHGYCGIAWNTMGITRFRLAARDRVTTERALLRRAPDAVAAEPSGVAAEAVTAARRYFTGEKIDFASLPLDLSGQEPLFLRIYDATRRLAWGETTTYGALAQELGLGREVARDVGQAMASNPVPLIIPCHRVLAAGGKIGGFSAPGGSAAKLLMLQMEGTAPPPPAQPSLAL